MVKGCQDVGMPLEHSLPISAIQFAIEQESDFQP